MKFSIHKLFPVILAALVLLCFGMILNLYTTPMQNISLDLSPVFSGDADPEAFDSKGWTVFTQEGDAVTVLTPDSRGGYTGLEPGQTFYFSRLMVEDLDTPTLRLRVTDQTFAIFLDGELIYTDFAHLDNRIGYLHLPAREAEVDETLTISLPADLRGKVLTIAQSTKAAEDQDADAPFFACPSTIQLYCGYSYESKLIAESFSAAILASILFLVGVALLAAFVRFRSVKCLCIAFVAFLCMTSQLGSLSFFYTYFHITALNVVESCYLLAAFALLIYLTLHSARKRSPMWIWIALCGAAIAAYFVACLAMPGSTSPFVAFLKGGLQEWMLILGLVAVVGLCASKMPTEIFFCRMFISLTAVAMVVYWGMLFLVQGSYVWLRISLDIRSGHITFLYYRILPLLIVSALIAALVHVFRREIQQRTEKHLLEQRREMTLASYENMRRQHEEVMIIRHDIIRHFRTLRAMSAEPQVTDYLDDLLGQNSKIRPVVQSGNEMLDIILNSRLSDAADAGLLIEIVKAEVPENLPLSNADLCSLVMNIMDNALTAAINSHHPQPFIRLDIHVKSNFMVFVCENSTTVVSPDPNEKTQTVPRHGLGLKIIRSIAQRYEGLVDTEYDDVHYRIRVAVPLL